MDDSVVGRAADSDLFALGQVSGDIRQFFSSDSGIKSYKELGRVARKNSKDP